MDLKTAIHDSGFAWGGPVVSGRLRASPEDFQVSELPLLEPAGEGEHVWLLLRKRQENTEQVARQLARMAGVPPRSVSYAGLKDRNAVTEQWFSVHLPGGGAPDWSALDSPTLTLLRQVRHHRKLRRGALRGNAFTLRVREVAGDRQAVEQRLEAVASGGMPNYFGEQRFGRDGSNLLAAERLFSQSGRRLSRHQRGLALSAARSLLFNRVLDHRVKQQNWNRAIAGEALQLNGSHSYFVAEQADETLQARLREMDIHPTGPLWGRGETPVLDACRALESGCLASYAEWRAGLEAAGLRQERRALRVTVGRLAWTWLEPDGLELSFQLPAGAYATSLLRELLRQASG